MPSYPWPERCGNCARRLREDEEEQLRKVPRRGGQEFPVCDSCAEAIDRQGTIELELAEEDIPF